MIKKFCITLFLLISSYGMAITPASAEVAATIQLFPKNPEPNSTVTVTFVSYSFNPDTAMIRWVVNGEVVTEGMGKKSISIKTGASGTLTKVVVTAETADNYKASRAITITPASVNLVYEAPKSYVPLFYEGRSLPSEGGVIDVVAIPSLSSEGSPLDPSTLSYSWYVNDSLYKSASGLGKSLARIKLDFLQNKNTIKVVVRSPEGVSAEKSITVYPHAVMPVLYTYDSLLGVDLTRAIEKRFETVKEFTLSLEPYYVSSEQAKPATYTWYLNGLPTTPLNGRLLALQPKENTYGSKLLRIDVTGSDKRLQKATIQTELIFDTRK
jgi:hypothetical protein